MHRTTFYRSRKLAFTLIELLIVVAIIAILAAIAVPNFLEAQTRSKVSRAKADMRTVATGIESYAVDNNGPPYCQLPMGGRDWYSNGGFPLGYPLPDKMCAGITTPIAYLTSMPIDPFDTKMPPREAGQNAIKFLSAKFGFDRGPLAAPMPIPVPGDAANGPAAPWGGVAPDVMVQNGVNGRVPAAWVLYSLGPDGTWFLDFNGDGVGDVNSPFNNWNLYDSTNGTVSQGNVVRSSGGAIN